MDFLSLPALQTNPLYVAAQSHAHPEPRRFSIKQPTRQIIEAFLSDNMFRHYNGTLHFRCTYVNCGVEFGNSEDLLTHRMRAHQFVETSLPVRTAVRQGSELSTNSTASSGSAKHSSKRAISDEVKNTGRLRLKNY